MERKSSIGNYEKFDIDQDDIEETIITGPGGMPATTTQSDDKPAVNKYKEIDAGDEQNLIDQLLQQFKENRHALHLEARESLARSLAQSTSIKSGQRLSVTEMGTLIDELFVCKQPETAPNGRRSFATFTLDELEKRFAR